MTQYVVGDIQGCVTPLKRLLRRVGFTPAKDRLIATGDLIGRGNEGLATLSFLRELGDSFTTVLGNHDLHFLAVCAGVAPRRHQDGFDDILDHASCDLLRDWLRGFPLALALDNNTLVTHAGLYPQWSMAEAIGYSSEIQSLLRSHPWQALMASMYGNQPDQWQQQLSGPARSRFIINALTRMRYIQANCRLELSCKVPPAQAPAHLTPWFDWPNPSLSQENRIIFGHWAALEGQTHQPRMLNLDTGYIWGGALTLLNLDNLVRTLELNQRD